MRVLILNQAFYPDVVSTAQHASDLASALVDRGHEVTVLCSSRAYDSIDVRYPRREMWKGVNIRRISCLGLGKARKWQRAGDFASFLVLCALQLIVQPRHEVVIAMTSPPLISFLAALFATLKKCRLVCWIMDLNPDEAVAAGWLSEKSAVAKVLQRMLVYALRSAERIVVLDRFMKERIERKGVSSAVVEVIPPWSHDNQLSYDAQGRSRFRRLHGLEDKFVVMYSGNHSPCHPLGTLLNAALELSDASDIVFCFVGGGSEFSRVRQFAADHALRNVVCLPYQPLNQLSASLSAADLHVVILGAPFVGIVHPCKVYNILTLGIPFLYIGPEPSHITDLPGAGEPWRYYAPHGDPKAVVAQLQLARVKATPGNAMETAVAQKFSHRVLTRRMIAAIEGGSLLPAEAARERAAAL